MRCVRGFSGRWYTAVSTALANLPTTTEGNLPRLADWALWVKAAEPATGLESGSILRSFHESREAAIKELLSSEFATKVLGFAADQEWKGTGKELVKALDLGITQDQDVKVVVHDLRILQTALESQGVLVGFGRSHGQKLISIKKAYRRGRAKRWPGLKSKRQRALRPVSWPSLTRSLHATRRDTPRRFTVVGVSLRTVVSRSDADEPRGCEEPEHPLVNPCANHAQATLGWHRCGSGASRLFTRPATGLHVSASAQIVEKSRQFRHRTTPGKAKAFLAECLAALRQVPMAAAVAVDGSKTLPAGALAGVPRPPTPSPGGPAREPIDDGPRQLAFTHH